MPRRERPQSTTRSEHWLRVAVNKHPDVLDARLIESFGWPAVERISWRSPIHKDGYAEYYDEAFLERLGIADLKVPLREFWPASGPRWDALARTESGKLILVEAKAHIDEIADRGSRAVTEASVSMIRSALKQAKKAFGARDDVPWDSPFYQHANRLAHLYFLHEINGLDAYLAFVCFANAPDVPRQTTASEWEGALRLVEGALGLGRHPFRNRIATLILDVPEMLAKPHNSDMPGV